MYFTNQLASRPFFLTGGMAATIDFLHKTLARRDRYIRMRDFFGGAPTAAAAAVADEVRHA